MRTGVLAVLGGFSLACSPQPGPPCRPRDPVLLVHVDPAQARGTVSTTGACTAPLCIETADAGQGCLTWKGAVTGTEGSSCSISLSRQDGGRASVKVPLSDACGEKRPVGVEVFFDAFGNTIWTVYTDGEGQYGA